MLTKTSINNIPRYLIIYSIVVRNPKLQCASKNQNNATSPTLHLQSQATIAEARSIGILHRGIQIVQVRAQAFAWRFLDRRKKNPRRWMGQRGGSSRPAPRTYHQGPRETMPHISAKSKSSIGWAGGFLVNLWHIKNQMRTLAPGIVWGGEVCFHGGATCEANHLACIYDIHYGRRF